MAKHKSVAIETSDLITRLDRDGDDNFGPWESREEMDAAGDGWWLVSWPEHVISPRYNGDAMYSACEDESDARDNAETVYGE
jgi:hypothetical protein